MYGYSEGEFILSRSIIKKDYLANKYVYLMAVPVVAFYIIFNYMPMYGVLIAFKDYNIKQGIWASPWVGLANFKEFFASPFCFRVIKNTILISLYDVVWGFPAPIILALLLNEISSQKYKKTIQTITYMPNFISMIVVVGFIISFTSSNGLISSMLSFFGMEPTNLLAKPQYFRTIYIASGIWQGVGFGSIIYFASLSNINSELYEAAMIDGAGRWSRLLHVTLPGIAPTITILLILRIGSLMSVGAEKIILLYSPLTYSTADTISSYVYRLGIQGVKYSYSTAVGLFNTLINLILLILANKISQKVSETSLW